MYRVHCRHSKKWCAQQHACSLAVGASNNFSLLFNSSPVSFLICFAWVSSLTDFFYYWWGGTKSLGTAATSGLLYKPQMIDEDDFWRNWWNEDWQGKPKYSEKTCPSATLSTTKSHMTRPGVEPRTAAVGSQRLTA
jgi:hypothetical protein